MIRRITLITVLCGLMTGASSCKRQTQSLAPLSSCQKVGDTWTNSLGMKFAYIPAGEFLMGPSENWQWWMYQRHKVKLTRPFLLGVCDVTRGQFAAFVKATGYQTDAERSANGFAFAWTWKNPGFEPGYDQTDDHPVVCVSWNDATAFCQWLSKKEQKTYRLPTEAQWEYACRAGTQTTYPWGDDLSDGIGWLNYPDRSWDEKINTSPADQRKHSFDLGSGGSDGFVFTSPVGSFKPNAFGLYDMVGNVWQWCNDYGPSVENTPIPDAIDPNDPTSSNMSQIRRTMRGGSWAIFGSCDSINYVRTDKIDHYFDHDVGFRCLLEIGPQEAPAVLPQEPKPKSRLNSAVHETALGTDPHFIAYQEASQDGSHLLVIAKGQTGWAVFFDGQPGKEYDSIDITFPGHPSCLQFSPLGKHLTYMASRGLEGNWPKERFIVVDSHDDRSHAIVEPGYPPTLSRIGDTYVASMIFSPDDKRIAYESHRVINTSWYAESIYVVVDGQKGPIHAWINGLKFSPDSKHYAYAARKGDHWIDVDHARNAPWFIVVDGKQGPEYDMVGVPVFSPDSKHVVYSAQRGQKTYLVLDGQETPAIAIGGIETVPIFSPDSNRVAYVGYKDSGRCVVVDGQSGAAYDQLDMLIFSPDSKHLAYWAMKGQKVCVVLDSREEPSSSSEMDWWIPRRKPAMFSPDSRHLAYVTRDDIKEQRVVVVDGQTGSEYDEIDDGSLLYDGDGRHMAYVAEKAFNWLAVVDGHEGKPYDAVRSLVFSPDGNHVAYIAYQGARRFVVVDGQEKPAYIAILKDSAVFSPDSKHVAFAALKNWQWLAVVDSDEGPVYDAIFAGTFHYNPDGTLKFLASRGGVLYRVQQDAPPGH